MRAAPTRPATPVGAGHVDVRASNAVDACRTRLRETGLVTVAGLMGRSSVLDFASRLMHVVPHPHSGPDGLTAIQDTGMHAHRAGLAGFGRGDLQAHTERAGVPNPPRLMLLVCLQPATEGGDVLLADGRDVLARLVADDRAAAVALAQTRTAYFGAGAGHPSQVFTVRPDGLISVRLRQDGLARWSPLVHPYLPALRRAVGDCQLRLRLAPGQGYLLDNHRWLHARTGFTGRRLCVRALGEPHRPMLAGFAPETFGARLPMTHDSAF
ncbi:TauD/TfdA family dioxygenase [Streptomyces sp. SAI-170]|uniref:TauD/TfdA family dioxygenase n=1 Tax=Streptomyces sp. SAI-170 TaxID=3377729 RepID=UPI003C7A76BC